MMWPLGKGDYARMPDYTQLILVSLNFLKMGISYIFLIKIMSDLTLQ